MDSTLLIIGIILIGPLIGSVIGVLKKPSKLFMFNMLAFAGGVMLAISFLELIPESIHMSSVWLCCIGILIGSLAMYALDKLIPHIHPELVKQEQGCNLKKASIYLLFGIVLHNFPEGMALAAGTVINYKTLLTLAIAMAIHNIPEGICTSAPLYHSTKKRGKSFLLSFSTGFSELAGFLVAAFVFKTISPTMTGIIVAATAGVMIYISADELIPSACSGLKGKWGHSTIFSLIFGVLFVILLGLL